MQTKFLPLFCTLVLASSVVIARDINKDFHKTFDVAEGDSIHLNHGDGDVRITSWDKDQLDVEVRYELHFSKVGWGEEPEFDVEFSQRGDEVSIVGHESSGTVVGAKFTSQVEYVYTIKAPGYMNLILHGDDGDVKIHDWQGSIECNLSDGDISLANIDAPDVKLKLDDGNVDIRDLHARLVVRGQDGNLRLQQCATPKVSIRTDDGDIDLEIVEVSTIDMDISTQDGRVDVELAPYVSAKFEIETNDGDIRTFLSHDQIEIRKEHRVSGQLADGAGTIDIQTDSGRVRFSN